MFRFALAALVAFAVPLLAAPVPKALKAKAPDANGKWEVTEYHSSGNKMTTPRMNWTIDGESLTIERMSVKGVPIKVAGTVTYSLVKPEGGGPNDLDYVIHYTNGVNPDRVYKGRMEQDGDTLKFCYATTNPNGGAVERPTECSEKVSGLYYVFKRAEAK